MSEIERIMDAVVNLRISAIEGQEAIEQYVQRRLYESNELKNEQAVIKARIEELEKFSKLWDGYIFKTFEANHQSIAMIDTKYMKRIEELKNELT